jgi:hypothetical protein
VGDPKLKFTIKETKESVGPGLREGKADRPPKVSKPSIAITDRSLSGCYELLQKLRQRTSAKQLFMLKGTSDQAADIVDLGGVEDNLVNGRYDSVDECRRDIIDFLDSGYQDFGAASDIGKVCRRFLGEIEKAFAQLPAEEPDSGIPELVPHFAKFSEVEIVDVGERIPEIRAIDVARVLNSLDDRQRTRAEWLIRIHCPTLPYFAGGIDISQLPYRVIESLQKLLQFKI